VALERPHHLRETVRQLWPHQAAAHQQRCEVRLVAESLGELQPAAEERLEVNVYDRFLLTWPVSLCECRARRLKGACAPVLARLAS
jgi:hypothetical protein